MSQPGLFTKGVAGRERPGLWSGCATTDHAQEAPLVADAATPRFTFATATPVPLVAAFDGGRRTSAGGLPWLAAAALGLCAAFAACLPAWRRRGRHALAALVRQRVSRLARGYA